MIDGRLGKFGRSSLNNQQFLGHRRWDIVVEFYDIWEIGKG